VPSTETFTNAVNRLSGGVIAGFAETNSLEELWARSPDPMCRKEKNMNNQNRVLVRQGARDLNEQAVEKVSGGFRTLTACTLVAVGVFDGECSN